MLKIVKICVLFAIAVIFSQCRKQDRIVDLVHESRLVDTHTEYVFHDYITAGNQYGMDAGFSDPRAKHRRWGLSPGSMIAFDLDSVQPLQLLLNARPNRSKPVICNGLILRLNAGPEKKIPLPEKGTGLIKLDLSQGDLRPGRNVIEIHYDFPAHPGKGTESASLPFFFPVVFSRLTVTSFQYPVRIHEVRKAHALINEIASGDPMGFGAPLPGSRDYYVDLTEGCRLQGECRFVPISNMRSGENALIIRVSLQQDEAGPEEMVAEYTVPAEPDFQAFRVALGNREGLARLRLTFGREDSRKAVDGILEFSSLEIAHTGKRARRLPVPAGNAERVNELQDRLSRLNTIVVVFDSARADHFSSYGYFRPTTPAIQRFAADAITFTRAYSETLSTRCSISTLFTGYPLPVTAVYEAFSSLPDELETLAEKFSRKGILTQAINGMGNIAADFRFDRGFDHFHELYKEPVFHRKSQEYLPHVLPWLEKNSQEHFFLYLHFKEPHSVYRPVPEFEGLFSNEFSERIPLEEFVKARQGRNLPPAQVRYVAACYDETLASADSVFARIHEKLKELDLLKKSIVLVIADHGEYLGEKGVFGHGISFHEPGIHIPFVMHLPRSIAADFPRRVHSMVKMTDVFKTLSDIYSLPLDRYQGHGRNFLPLLFDPAAGINDHVFITKRGTPGHCVIDGRYKLITFENGARELYDLSRDPGETRNLYTDKWIRAGYLERKIITWLDRQQQLRDRLISSEQTDDPASPKIHEKTLENLKSLGYL